MTTAPARRAMRETWVGLLLRLALFAVLLVVGGRLTADLTLPLAPGLVALVSYAAVLILVPVFVSNAICDQLDRRSHRRRAPGARVPR